MLNHSSSQTVQKGTVLSTQPKLAIQPKIRRTSIFSQINALFLVSFRFITVLMLNSTTSAQMTFTDVTDAAGLGDLQPNPNGQAGGTWGDYDNDGDVDLFSSEERLKRDFSATKGKGVEEFRMSHNQLACATSVVNWF